MVAHSQAEAMLFAPANLTTPSAVMTYVPQPAERMPRDQMAAIAVRYPAGLSAGSFETADVPFAPGAYRFENGVRMAGPGCTFQPPSCENMRSQRLPTLPGRESSAWSWRRAKSGHRAVLARLRPRAHCRPWPATAKRS